jgi:hypothetical protein
MQRAVEPKPLPKPLPKPPDRIPLRLCDALAPIPLTFDLSPHRPCLNAEVCSGMWTHDDIECSKELVSAERGFLNQLGRICIRAGIRCCFNEYCLKQRRQVENVVPKCSWEYFRMWAIEAVSCQLNMLYGEARNHIATAIEFCRGLLDWYHKADVDYDNKLLGYGSEFEYVEIAEVCDVIYWMMLVQGRLDSMAPFSEDSKWPPDFVPYRFLERRVKRAKKLATGKGICLNQVRNLGLVSGQGCADLLALMDYAHEFLDPGRDNHEDCVDTWCHVAHRDGTFAKRHHMYDRGGDKCDGDCKEVQFGRQKLKRALEKGMPTAWSNDEKETLGERDSFIAISHVWLDGTGGDKEYPCRVYGCNLDYWKRLSARLGCNGLWWDAICIPGSEEDGLREYALSRMHHNYADAEFTVVHDRYLVNFKYKDASSACLAILLSPWFTRCWTALELKVSMEVRVLFKGAHPGTPVMKDLNEILKCHPAYQPRAHIVAQSLIMKMRNEITTAAALIAILERRYASRPSDIKVISALLINWSSYDKKGSEAKFTRGILRRIGEIEMSALYHGFETMRPRGRFSWCPRALRDMPINPGPEFDDPEMDLSRLTICRDGSIEGTFHYRFLTAADVKKGQLEQLKPKIPRRKLNREEREYLEKKEEKTYQKRREKEREYIEEQKISQPADEDLLDRALRKWQNCLLLRANERSSGPAILVKTVGKGPSKDLQELKEALEEFEDEDDDYNSDDDYGVGDEEEVIDCRYVVAVRDKTRHAKDRNLWKEAEFSIGRDRKRPDVDARKLVGSYESRKK